MTADKIVDILLDAVDPKFLTNFVRGSFSVKLSGRNFSGDAVLRGDGVMTLLDEKDVVFRTKHFYIVEKEPGYYGHERLGKRFSIHLLQNLYPSLIDEIIWVYATASDPKTKGRRHLEYTGIVQKS